MIQRLMIATATAVIALLGASQPAAGQTVADPLLAGFQDPPQSARPRVWWHWMNGNITEDGIAKDLAWMKRIGIGGMHNFDASLYTPQVVENRLVYMTPEWQQAFRFAASQAAEHGLELGIAGSPGWSETGGPWVPPEDAIKKVVWSETTIQGGQRFQGPLAAPPLVAGPYQSLQAEGALGLARDGGEPPQAYGDIAVLALPVDSAEDSGLAEYRNGQGDLLDASLFSDHDLVQTVDLGTGSQQQAAVLRLSYPKPRIMRSATLFMKDESPSFGDKYFTPALEAMVDGEWRHLANFQLAPVPSTVAFAPVEAAEFRVVFNPYTGPRRPAQSAKVAGVVVPGFISIDPAPKPAKVAEFHLTGNPRVDRFESKAVFSLVNDYFALGTSASPEEQGTKAAQVIDLSDRMQPDGSLDWKAPRGNWKIYRFGWSLTGKTNHPASAEATGLEVDKMDGAAVERYLRHYLDMYLETVGADLFGERGVQVLMTDSTEVGAFNWTPNLIAQFRELRGYDSTPWLPTLAGTVIGTRGASDRFLFDFRQTLAELHAREHYATVAKVAHDYGLKVYGEALEDQRPVIGDDLDLRRYADVPMAALWTWTDEDGQRQTLLGDMKGASSVAHIYGQNITAAESMTSALAPFSDAPANLRRTIDLEFAHGINRPVIHTSVHQPLDDKQPGLTLMIFGQFFTRHESWAEMAKPWIDYLSRSSFLLQQGRNVADVAYFYGEEAPISAITAFGPPADQPERYAYDYVNAAILREVFSVEDGDLVAPSGARYRVLYLGPGASRMTLPTLRRIAELVEAGATVVGHAPESSPSLADDADEFAGLVQRLWSGGGVTQVGKGRVLANRDVEAALATIGVLPDVQIDRAAAAAEMMFVHRQLEDGDLYFLANRADREQQVNIRFRVFGKAPDIWHANTGKVLPTGYRQEHTGTTLPLTIGAEESVFVMFRRDTDQLELAIPIPELSPVLDLSDNWDVSFQPGRGAPPSLQLGQLASLSQQPEAGVRYFSGIANYSRQFTMPKGVEANSPLWLDLGDVGDLAEVRINGHLAGSPWHAPFRVDIAGLVKPGQNELEVRVANRWVNRLIGDAQEGATKITFTTIPTFHADAPLRPSGLIGPVRLLVGQDPGIAENSP